MAQKFITPVSMECTREQFDKDLMNELIDAGYDLNNCNYFDLYQTVITIGIQEFTTDKQTCERRFNNTYFIDHYNPYLFLALAAMTEGKDIGLGEYMLCIDDDIAPDKWEREKGELVKCLEYSHKCENKRGSFGPGYSRSHWRKATKGELIEHFTKKIYTIDDLKNGKCAVINDGTIQELEIVLKASFTNDTSFIGGKAPFYLANKTIKGEWVSMYDTKLPTQSVKDFIKQMDKQYKNTVECDEGFMYEGEFYPTGTREISTDALPETSEWKPKWGEEVEVKNDFHDTWNLRYFVGMNPTSPFYMYVVTDNCGCFEIYHFCRRPIVKELSTTEANEILSQHFNCSPDQIEIV